MENGENQGDEEGNQKEAEELEAPKANSVRRRGIPKGSKYRSMSTPNFKNVDDSNMEIRAHLTGSETEAVKT